MSIKTQILDIGLDTLEKLQGILPPDVVREVMDARQLAEASLKVNVAPNPEIVQKLADIKTVAELFSEDEFLVQDVIRETSSYVSSQWNAQVISELYAGAGSVAEFLEKVRLTLEESQYHLRLSDYSSFYNRQLGGLETPTGAQSKLTKAQQDYVRSAEFISWFGDWIKAAETGDYRNVSKLVDAETKEPEVVFHGTAPTTPFFRFDTKRTISPVVYVSNDYEYARWYADYEQNRTDRQAQKGGQKYVYQMFCAMKNPLDFRMFKLEQFTGEEVADIINVFTGYRPENVEAKNPTSGKPIAKTQLIWYFRYNPQLIVEIKRRTQFDGIIFLGYNPSHTKNGVPIPEDEILVFENKQLKYTHAAFFSEFVQDIRFKKGGEI